jgi:hypothetical protein
MHQCDVNPLPLSRSCGLDKRGLDRGVAEGAAKHVRDEDRASGRAIALAA